MARMAIRWGTVIVTIALLGPSCVSKKAGPLDQGLQAFEAEEYESARGYFETVLETEPENPEAVYYLGRIALESGRIDESVEYLEEAVALDEMNSEYHFRLGVAYAQQMQEVPTMEKARMAPKLKGEFERAVEIDSTNVDARMALAQYYMNAPPIVGGSREKAMEQVDKIRRLDPRRGHVFMAAVHARNKAYGDAEREYLAAMELDPDDADLSYRMGMLYQETREYGKAFDAFEKAIEIDPGYMRAMYQIGRTAVFAEINVERGIECLKIYLENEPGRGEPTWAHAHWRLGMLYETAGDKDMARAEYEAALTLDPDLKGAKAALEGL